MTFLAVVFIIVCALLVWRLGSLSKAKKHLRAGGNMAKGVWIFVFIPLLIGVAVYFIGGHARAGEWRYFQFVEVYAGLDWPTYGASVQCLSDGPDNKTTSNGGVRINIAEWKRFAEINAKYTHHSCAFNPDRNLVDALGFEFTFSFFDKRR